MEYMRLPNGLKVAHVTASETSLLYRRLFVERGYLCHGVTVKAGDVVFDAGANIGMATLQFHLRAADVTVHAYEPSPGPFAALAENFRLHRLRGGARQVAVGEKPGTALFTYYPKTTVMSGLHADVAEDSALTRAFLRKTGFADSDVEDILADKYRQEQLRTEVTTISQEIAATGVDRVDLLKLDIEKAELEALRGIEESDWPKVRQVVAEVHDIDGRLAEFTGLLEGHGFEVVAEQEDLLVGTEVYAVYAVRR